MGWGGQGRREEGGEGGSKHFQIILVYKLVQSHYYLLFGLFFWGVGWSGRGRGERERERERWWPGVTFSYSIPLIRFIHSSFFFLLVLEFLFIVGLHVILSHHVRDHGHAVALADEIRTWRWRRRRRRRRRSSHGRHVGPIERRSAEEHIADKRFDGRFTHQTHEEQLLNHLKNPKQMIWHSPVNCKWAIRWWGTHLRRDGAQRREPEQEFAEAGRLRRVLRPAIFLQGALRFLLQALDVRHVRQPARICTPPPHRKQIK